ncbi:hypothetical protein [Celerinatantimonas sp. YJH-8]|uniref:hypothetical protein n=1 Tax=Celerinatantimonas sp. YJH-8 TaxID=3228714 RepID=UPI0038BFA354
MNRIVGWIITGIGFSIGLSPAYAADLSWLNSLTDKDHWYLYPKSSTTTLPPLNQKYMASGVHVLGGYQSKLPANLHWFVEAGIQLSDSASDSDIATQQGFNLATGLRYTPIDSLVISGQILHPKSKDTFTEFNDHSLFNLDMQLQGTYIFPQRIAIQASYWYQTIPATSLIDQQLNIGLNYHF